MQEDKLKHYVLISYSLAKLSQKEKVKHIRKLFGYKNIKSKTYTHKGLIDETNAKKIAQNVILVPFENSIVISNFFKDIDTEVKEVWLKD
ncbi:MAG: hypothetical protein ABIC04_03290 [Nanoarchaeota archaeon]